MTSETGNTVTDSVINKPDNILSLDVPIIQTGKDVDYKADSIVGNTGQHYQAPVINCR